MIRFSRVSYRMLHGSETLTANLTGLF